MGLGAVGRSILEGREGAVMIGRCENVSTAHREKVQIYLNFPSPERNRERERERERVVAEGGCGWDHSHCGVVSEAVPPDRVFQE